MNYPGADLLEKGILDLKSGVESVESLLVSIGYPRLIRAGFEIPDPIEDSPEHRLYALLARENSDSAHLATTP